MKLKLNDRGEKLLWLRLKDALNRTLGLHHRYMADTVANITYHPRNNSNNE